jgi:hypothetical protein
MGASDERTQCVRGRILMGITHHLDTTMTTPATADRAGWRIRDWTRAVGIARSTYYMLGDIAPRAIKIGRMHIIRESPADWLRRVGRDVERRAA